MKIYLKIIASFLFLSLFIINSIADELDIYELPSGGNVVSGDVTITKEPGKLTINQTSTQGIIEWQKFNVGVQSSVYFNHTSNTDSILNQIISGTKSIILGNIYSNGKLFINNPNGITVGANANIKAHSFIGSAMKIANQELHKFVSKGFLKKNTAARKVGRLQLKVNAIA